jgi:hypothetical protein
VTIVTNRSRVFAEVAGAKRRQGEKMRIRWRTTRLLLEAVYFYFFLWLDLMLLLRRQLRVHRLRRKHLLIVELLLGQLEICGPTARHIVQLLGHDEQSRPRLRINC